jgi:hypothetical protein
MADLPAHVVRKRRSRLKDHGPGQERTEHNCWGKSSCVLRTNLNSRSSTT